jgi:hypothetical protein
LSDDPSAVTVNGEPVCIVASRFSCHPPNTLPASALFDSHFWFFPNGDSMMPLMLRMS